MDVREHGLARLADQPQHGAGFDPLSWGHDDASLAHMAVLADPTAAVVEDHAVAAFAIGDGGIAAPLNPGIGHFVAHPLHRARGRGDHSDALTHGHQVGDPDIGALVAVVAQQPAGMVARERAGIPVDVVLDETDRPHFTVDGQAEPRAGFLGCGGGGEYQRHRDHEIEPSVHPSFVRA